MSRKLSVDVFELEPTPGVARMLLLSACDGQQATIERAGESGRRALLRLQLPIRPDPRSYTDWRWVACPIALPPTIAPHELASKHAVLADEICRVPARNTSKHCPHCLTPLRHRKAPDRPTTPGWKWAVCPGCGWQGDRDQGAWRRIAARGLTHQTNAVTDNASGHMQIRTVVDNLEAKAKLTPTPHTSRDRSKTGPTRHKPTRPAPRRRRAPSPTGPPGPAGKRPEGHAPTDRTRLPRAAHRHQSVRTISTPTNRHKPQGAALGAGFHLHAHATPPRWADPTPDTTSDMGSLS